MEGVLVDKFKDEHQKEFNLIKEESLSLEDKQKNSTEFSRKISKRKWLSRSDTRSSINRWSTFFHSGFKR